MGYSFVNLLPQSGDALIRDAKMRRQIIDFLRFAIKQLMETIKRFYINKDYEAFDPHVGETSCQIRACEMTLLADGCFSANAVSNRLQILDDLLRKMNEPLSIEHNHQSTIADFLAQNGMDFEITETELFLWQAYFLTHFKRQQGCNETFIDYDAIASEAGISRKFAKKCVRHYQLWMAQHSCDAVMKWAEELQ